MSSYLIFKLISIAVMLVIILIIVIGKKPNKQEENTKPDDTSENKPENNIFLYKRTGLYHLEYKLIPLYLDEIKKSPENIKKLYDLSYWEKDIEMFWPSNSINWDDFSCEIFGDVDSKCLIVYEFPKPFDVPLAKYGAVYINKPEQYYSYYTLELSYNKYVLGSTSSEQHLNYGLRENLNKDEFVAEIITTLGIDDSILQNKRLIQKKFSISDFIDLTEITDDNYNEFIHDNQCAIVCFYDLISVHSKIMLPVLSDYATEFKDRIKVGIYDVYGIGNETVRENNKITAMPTFLFFKNGLLEKKHIGICRKDDLKKWFEELCL